mgnify:CR=1 FL=1
MPPVTPRKYKHLLVPASYVDSDGVRLGVWISNLRAARKNRPDSYQVTPAHIKKLNSIGMVWDARDAKWGTAYQQAKAYYKAHGQPPRRRQLQIRRNRLLPGRLAPPGCGSGDITP